MIVLCSHQSCGAVLRVAAADTALTAVLLADRAGRYFICPRCFRRTDLSPSSAAASLVDDLYADDLSSHPPSMG
jgi:hypothetical protein